MKKLLFLSLAAVLVYVAAVLGAPAAAQQYSAKQTGDLVQLEDAKNQTVVSVETAAGNIVYSMKVKGQEVLYFPYGTIDDFKAKPGTAGIPFMGPWINRLDEQAFYANGKKYNFDMELGNVRGAIPLHGLLTTQPGWKIVEAKADGKSAWVTSRLEFYRNPMWMKQWPFAHVIEITQRLQDGVLEVRTRLENLSTEPMPAMIGYHSYFKLTDSLRNDWTLSVGANSHVILQPNMIPTGEMESVEKKVPNHLSAAMKELNFDDCFTDLVRDAQGWAVVTIKGKTQSLDVLMDRNYPAFVLYGPNPNAPIPQRAGAPPPAPGAPPPDRNWLAIEPMAGITNAPNLVQKGLYKELQSVPPGKTWEATFRVRTAGF
jgi:aldose 1-epimerase